VLEPDGLSLPTITQAEIERWRVVTTYHRASRFGRVAQCYLGEIMFNASNEDLISPKKVGPRIFRGGNINRYQLLDEAKQGEVVFLHYDQYLEKYSKDARITHHRLPRIAFQEAAPIDNWRRLIPSHMPSDRICGHTLRYFSTDARYDLFAILACFASTVCEWRFGLTSTNNHVNAYEVDALPIPVFARLMTKSSQKPLVDWNRWESALNRGDDGVVAWEMAVVKEMETTSAQAEAWPDTVHDSLATAGKEMSRLGAERQILTNDFAAWLVETLDIDEEKFTGMTYLRGGQATFDQMGWQAFLDLLNRNHRACRLDPSHSGSILQSRYDDVSSKVLVNRTRFVSLDAAIDRIMWQLLGLKPDGSLPT
jgi:hypothetical protein